jgi:sugar/nucleoside kinase (ribokinase family)
VVGRGEVEVAIVKLGARGSLVGTRTGLWRIPVKPVRAVDTTGAGDAYAGGFLYGWTRGWSPEACGRLASTVAGLTVAQVGAVVADRARMAAALAESR